MTVNAVERLTAFQSRHLIAPATVDDPILGSVTVCSVDRVRIHPIRTGWRHDTAETTRLYAQVTASSWPQSTVAAVMADVAREDAFVNGRLTFERDNPEDQFGTFCWYDGHAKTCTGRAGGEHELAV